MKRILYIAPHSFPIKSSESICNAKLAFALAQYGYKVDVYAFDSPSTYPLDRELTNLLSSSPNLKITIIKSDYIISSKDSLSKIAKSIFYNLKILLSTGYFYNGISLPYLLLKRIQHDIKKNGLEYDIMITRGYYTDFVGIKLAKQYKLKWIANWNDPYPLQRFPSPYGSGYNTKLSFFSDRINNAIQQYASIHTFPNVRLRDYMLKCFKKVNIKQTAVVPHMALSTLFEKRNLNDGILRIIHCGDLKSPRSPREFLRALANYLCDFPADRSIIRCLYIGGIDNDIPQLIIDLRLSDIVLTRGGISYQEAIDEISKSNISLIIEAKCAEGIYLPTKVIDSLQSGVPIFAISPEIGVLRDFIEQYDIGYYANNTLECEIYNKIKQIVVDFKNNNLPIINPNSCPRIFEKSIIEEYKKLL